MKKKFMNPFSRNEAVGQRNAKTMKVLGPEEFLYSSKGGYFEKPSGLLEMGEELRNEDAEELQKAFEFMKAGLRCVKESSEKQDVGGNAYRYYNFFRSKNAQPGVKVLMVGPMEQIMNDYQDGVLQINFDLYDLVDVAKSL